ncbi:MAG TPA: hypothetical protein PLU50_08300, partial [Pseudobdellovibrionaceae bacterium]|nr:hypothetical protein [Pseudobdellovibrionaceae bacterium]
LYSLYFIDHSLFIREITNDLKTKMNSKVMSFDEWVNEVYSFVAAELDEVKKASAISAKQIGILNVLVEAAVLYVDALAEVQIPYEEKLKLIQVWSDWAPWTNSKFAPQLKKSLQRIQDLGTPSELLRRKPLVTAPGPLNLNKAGIRFLNERAFAHWEDDLTRELNAVQSPDEFEKKIDSIFNMAVKYTTPVSRITSDLTQLLDPTSAAYTRIINTAITVLKRLKLPLSRAFPAFQTITISGGTFQSDLFFEESLLPSLPNFNLGSYDLKVLANTLQSHHLKIAVAKIYFERIGFDQFNFLQSKADISMFMGKLEKLVPGASFAKDDYIESLAWSLKINDLALLERLSEAKSLGRSSNISPYVINLASILSESFATMDPQEKWDLIRYLSTPENVDIPESTRKFVTNLVGKLPAGGDEANRKATRDNRVESLITHLKRLKQLPMLEKIPCIEFLLTNGQRPWIRDHVQLDKSWLALLGLQPQSPMALALEDYLAVIPPHKISTTMAYLLARRGEN